MSKAKNASGNIVTYGFHGFHANVLSPARTNRSTITAAHIASTAPPRRHESATKPVAATAFARRAPRRIPTDPDPTIRYGTLSQKKSAGPGCAHPKREYGPTRGVRDQPTSRTRSSIVARSLNGAHRSHKTRTPATAKGASTNARIRNSIHRRRTAPSTKTVYTASPTPGAKERSLSRLAPGDTRACPHAQG